MMKFGITKKKFTIYGNCQSGGLAAILLQHETFSKRFDYVHIKPVQELNRDMLNHITAQIFSDIDLLIYQPVTGGYRGGPAYSSASVISTTKDTCEKIAFPSCYFRGYFPELNTLKDSRGNNVQAKFTIDSKEKLLNEHDYNLIRFFLDGKTPESVCNILSDPDFYVTDYLQKTANDSIEELRKREVASNLDIKISGIKENYLSRQLFHQFNHPTSIMFSYMP